MNRTNIVVAALVAFGLVSGTARGRAVPAGRDAHYVPPMSFHWWRGATPGRRIDAIAAAIQGLEAGWTFGADADRGVVQTNLKAAYAKGDVSHKQIAIALQPRRGPFPIFSQPLAIYRAKVDLAYARNPKMRNQDIAVVLLCFTDTPVIPCTDDRGRPLR